MLRITIENETGRTTFRLAGRLAEAWVAELRRCYHESAQASANLVVDLDDVTFIDEAGSALLGEMFSHGVLLFTTDPLMKSIVDELSLREEHNRSCGTM